MERLPKLTDAAEMRLALIQQDYACELSNHRCFSEHVIFASADEANMAMLREAFRAGVKSTEPADTYDTDLARILSDEIKR